HRGGSQSLRAGCTLGDIIAEFAVFGLAASTAGQALFAEYLGDYLPAISLDRVSVPGHRAMRGLSLRKGLVEAAKADILSLTAFEVGLLGWMALMHFVFFPHPPLHSDSPVYWFFMQLGMILVLPPPGLPTAS
ncbi:MAG: DUF4396 domain-containing protein, partial [Actinobacteria bacterium]|nr:DUF4396 domain-containing protein [Actinomycetota bacterium]